MDSFPSSSAATRPLIPPPAGDMRHRRNLQENMRLGDNPDLFTDFVGSLTSLAHSMLEIGKDYSGQKRQKWQAFEKKACDINPFLRYYSDAWPVKAFMQPHLYRLKSLVKTSCSHTRTSRTSETTCPQIRSEGLRTRSQEALANKLNNTRPPDIIIIDDDSPEPTSHKDIVTSDSLVLRDFLRGMHLKFDIDELIKSLLRMGISNKDQLVDVLTWPEEQQKAFFMLDVRMTCFEYRSLVHHLRAKLRD